MMSGETPSIYGQMILHNGQISIAMDLGTMNQEPMEIIALANQVLQTTMRTGHMKMDALLSMRTMMVSTIPLISAREQ